jgi:hypothetical protein
LPAGRDRPLDAGSDQPPNERVHALTQCTPTRTHTHAHARANRGGVPVCFPQFGQLGPLGQHGFARNTAFEVVESSGDSVTLVRPTGREAFLREGPLAQPAAGTLTLCRDAHPALPTATPATPQLLKASGEEDARYPHPFDLTVAVTLEDEALTQRMMATNTGRRAAGADGGRRPAEISAPPAAARACAERAA